MFLDVLADVISIMFTVTDFAVEGKARGRILWARDSAVYFARHSAASCHSARNGTRGWKLSYLNSLGGRFRGKKRWPILADLEG